MSPMSTHESLLLKKTAFFLAAIYLCVVTHRLYMGLQLTVLNVLDPNKVGSFDPVEMAFRNVVFSFLRPDIMYHSQDDWIWYEGRLLAAFISLHGIVAMLWVCGSKSTRWIPWITGSVALVWLLIYLRVVGLVQSQYFIRPVLILLMSGLGLLLGKLWVKWFGSVASPAKELSPHA